MRGEPNGSRYGTSKMTEIGLIKEKSSGLNVGPGERFFIEYPGLQSTSEADDGRQGFMGRVYQNQSRNEEG